MMDVSNEKKKAGLYKKISASSQILRYLARKGKVHLLPQRIQPSRSFVMVAPKTMLSFPPPLGSRKLLWERILAQTGQS